MAGVFSHAGYTLFCFPPGVCAQTLEKRDGSPAAVFDSFSGSSELSVPTTAAPCGFLRFAPSWAEREALPFHPSHPTPASCMLPGRAVSFLRRQLAIAEGARCGTGFHVWVVWFSHFTRNSGKPSQSILWSLRRSMTNFTRPRVAAGYPWMSDRFWSSPWSSRDFHLVDIDLVANPVSENMHCVRVDLQDLVRHLCLPGELMSPSSGPALASRHSRI